MEFFLSTTNPLREDLEIVHVEYHPYPVQSMLSEETFQSFNDAGTVIYINVGYGEGQLEVAQTILDHTNDDFLQQGIKKAYINYNSITLED